jgi:leader peptidase (prepilin peptidase)/N-methyltransferase
VITIELIVSLLGLSLGSFINACAYRIPRGISVVSPRSFCPGCQTTLRWHEIIPVVSFLVERARCRNCSSRISLIYPVGEILTGALVLLLFLKHGVSLEFVTSTTFALLMVLVAVIDWRHLIIPNKIVVSGLILGLLLKTLPLNTGELVESAVASLVAGAVTLSVLLLGNWIFRKETMGMGDVKLCFLIGFYLGLQGFLVSLWLAAFSGAIFGTARIIVGKFSVENRIPFGSLLAGASILYLLLQIFFQRWIDLWLTSILL